MTPSTTPPFLDPTLRQYTLDHQMLGHTVKTLKSRRETLAMLARYLGKPLLEATDDDLLRWFYGYEGATIWTRITYGRTVRSYYRWALRRQMIASDPSLMLPIPRPPQPNPDPLTGEEVQVALAGADPRTRLFLILAAGAGLRAVEISRMRREDLAEVDGRWLLTVPLGKGNKRRVVAVSEWLASEVTAWKSTPGRMFQLTPASVSNLTNQYLHSLGIARTLHKGRASFATTFYKATRDVIATAEALGHANVNTVTFYTQSAPQSRAEALTALDTLLRGEAA